jgi:hypothetical protein
MSTTETYDFGSPLNEQIITDAYERIGVIVDFAVQQKIHTALRSINFILQSWMNNRLNLFTIKQGMLSLNSGQSAYVIPDHAVDILEATVRTSSRNLGGVAASQAVTGGVAADAFDGNPNTHCLQTAPNGYISYGWPAVNYPVSMLGVTSFVSNNYTLIAEYSFDNATWLPALTIPTQNYAQLVLNWFVIPVPVPAQYFRIRETGGATLDISELYFNTNINDLPITKMSRSEYVAYSNKNTPGQPSLFWVDRQISPVLYLYQTPNAMYNNLYYTYKRQIQDIGRMTNTAEIPARFLDALTAALAYRLAVKEGKLDRVNILKQDMAESYAAAAFEDGERVTVRVSPQPSQNWSN